MWRSHHELIYSLNSEQTPCAVDCEVRAAQVVLLRTIESSLQRSESLNDASADDGAAHQSVTFRVPEDARRASTAAQTANDSGSVSVSVGAGGSGTSGAIELTPRVESKFNCVSRCLNSFAWEVILIIGLAVIIFGVIVYVIGAEIQKMH